MLTGRMCKEKGNDSLLQLVLETLEGEQPGLQPPVLLLLSCQLLVQPLLLLFLPLPVLPAGLVVVLPQPGVVHLHPPSGAVAVTAASAATAAAAAAATAAVVVVAVAAAVAAVAVFVLHFLSLSGWLIYFFAVYKKVFIKLFGSRNKKGSLFKYLQFLPFCYKHF